MTMSENEPPQLGVNRIVMPCEHDERFRGVMFAKNGCVACQAEKIAEQRNAWRAACRYLYEVIAEGGSKGRPMDLIHKGDYGRIITMIGKAESLED